MLEIEQDFIKVNNFTKGRDGQKIEALVIHIMEGSFIGTDSWFDNDDSNVSAHYGVSKKGEVKQWVRDEDQAWHAGIKKDPVSVLVRGKGSTNPNAYTIGIEFEGSGQYSGTAEQLMAGAQLISMLCLKYQIPLDPIHIIKHNEIRVDKTCPGKLDVGRMVEQAKLGVSKTSYPRALLDKITRLGDDVADLRANLNSLEMSFEELKKLL